MKLIVASALAAVAAAKFDALPFLMMDSFGNTYSTGGGMFSNPMALMALGGNKLFKGSNNMLPFLMMDSFGNTYSTAPSVLSDPIVTASLSGNKIKANRALSDEQLLLLSGGLQGGLANPFALSTLTGNKKYNIADAYQYGGDIPLMAAAGNLKNFNVAAEDMALPMVVNSLAGGARPSLSKHVIPAMALTGEDIEMETILPWMLTAGQHYLGGQLGQVLPFMGNNFKKAFEYDKLMPWLVSGLNTRPVAPVAPRVAPRYPAYTVPYRPIYRAPVAAAPLAAAPIVEAVEEP